MTILQIIAEYCFLPDFHGPCNEDKMKWFYDSKDGICKAFAYGGCQSNGNNFDTHEECEYRCGQVQGIPLFFFFFLFVYSFSTFVT